MKGCTRTEPRHMYQRNTKMHVNTAQLSKMKNSYTTIIREQKQNYGMFKYRATSYVSKKHKKAYRQCTFSKNEKYLYFIVVFLLSL